MGNASSFWQRVSIGGPYACWLWTGAVNKHGYGTLKWRGAYDYAHRLAWKLVHGPIADKTLVVMHKCDVPLCCNPRHLLLGTVADNTADMIAKGRARFHVPKPGKPQGLTLAQIATIKQRLAEGRSQASIAADLGTSQSTVSRIKLTGYRTSAGVK